MAGSSFGTLFRITTFGESHGPGVGVIVEGATPGLPLCDEDIQIEMNRRKPGQSDITTPRQESDRVHIMSGVFEGHTTGTPIGVVLYNQDMRPSAYEEIRDLFRPGHADYTYLQKYGVRDYRGSGRASGRETAGRVAGGAIAKKLLSARGIRITAYTLRAAGIACEIYDPEAIEKNPMRACDPQAAEKMAERVRELSAAGDSVGGIVECRVNGLPAGLGDPVFEKLDAELGRAILSLGSIKGIEFGVGFGCADMNGSEHNDGMDTAGFISNNAGGILGGISTGQEIIFRAAVKPTSSITVKQKTRDIHGNEREIVTEGRHDPCICPRIVPVIEAMTAIVLEDHYLRQATLRGQNFL